MSPDKISEYPNAQLTFPRPFVGRILAGGAAMAVPAAAAAASGAAAREGSAKARVADHISQAVQSTSNLLHLMQQSSPSQVRLFSFGSSPIFVWFEVLWVLVGGEVVGGSVSWKRINFFFCYFCTPDYVFCESDSISCHGLKYQISCMLDYPICESVSILVLELGIRYHVCLIVKYVSLTKYNVLWNEV